MVGQNMKLLRKQSKLPLLQTSYALLISEACSLAIAELTRDKEGPRLNVQKSHKHLSPKR